MEALIPRLPTARSWLIACGAALVGLVVAVVCVVGGLFAAIALAGLVVGGLLFLYAPGVLFGLYLLIPFYKGAFIDVMPIDLTVLLAGANMMQIVPLVLDRDRRAISRAGVALWVGLLVLIALGVFWAPDQRLAMSRLMNWILLVCLPVSIGALRVGSRPSYVRQLLWSFLGMGVVEVVVGLSMLSSTQRLEVLGANTIAVARAALLVPLMAGLIVLRSRFTLVRLMVLVLIPASFVVAVASGSRGPILMLGILIVIAIGLRIIQGRSIAVRPSRSVVAFGLASIVVLAVTASQIPAESLERYTNLQNFLESGGATTGVDNSSLERVFLFDAAFKLFETHPVIGVGTAGYAVLGPKVIGVGNDDAYPHNALLQFGAEYGFVGIAIFGALLLLAVFRPLPDDASRALKLLMLFFLFNAMVSGDIFDDRTLWGLIMLILLVDVRRFAAEADQAVPHGGVLEPADADKADQTWDASHPERRPSAI